MHLRKTNVMANMMIMIIMMIKLEKGKLPKILNLSSNYPQDNIGL